MTKLSTWTTNLLRALAVAAAALLLAPQSFAHTCEERLSPSEVKFETLNSDFIKVNGVAITGEFLYPLDLVLKDLDLKSEEVPKLLQGRTVLSLGEGVSGFLPFLVRQGLKVKGVDLWYHSRHFPQNYSGELMRDYVAKWGPYLIQGDARDIPVPPNSVDFVFSHMLVNNVKRDTKEGIVKDVIRVLKPGQGEARLYGFADDAARDMRKYLEETFHGKVGFEFKPIQNRTDYNGEIFEETSNLLILRKSR